MDARKRSCKAHSFQAPRAPTALRASAAAMTLALVGLVPSPPALAQSAAAVPAPRGAVSVKVKPNATCTLYRPGADPTAKRAVGTADEQGVIRLLLAPAWGSQVEVDCNDPATGSVSTSVVDLNDQSTFFTEDLTLPTPVIGELPALTGDPLRPSQAELRAAGYPPRPDPLLAPAGYNRWLDHVSRPIKHVAIRHVAYVGPTVNGTDLTGEYPVNGNNWGGPTMIGSVEPTGSTTRYLASVVWLTAPDCSFPHSNSQAAFWAGVSGFYSPYANYPQINDGSLIQAGDLCGIDIAVPPLDYFVEYFSFSAQYGTGIDIWSGMSQHPGDSVEFIAAVSDGTDDNPTPPPTQWAGFRITNYTIGLYQQEVNYPAPYNIVNGQHQYVEAQGMTSEYIVERPSEPPYGTNGVYFADYGNQMMYGYGFDQANNYHDITTDFFINTALWDNANTALLETSPIYEDPPGQPVSPEIYWFWDNEGP
jgi:hypothetical protein